MSTSTEDDPFQTSTLTPREATEDERALLQKQNDRLVPEFRAGKFQGEARKHWDLFYKRNETKFFKDRHWTTREFEQLADLSENGGEFTLLEVGCGVGNFVFPLLEELPNVRIYACDFSARAVEFVRQHEGYSTGRVSAFQADITQPLGPAATAAEVDLPAGGVDVISMVFVLSAVKPSAFAAVFSNLSSALRSGGRVFFRDYAVNDMAMVRFGPGTKMAERHYLRHDGTTSYFFTAEELKEAAEAEGTMRVVRCEYVRRRTVNKKEGIDAERVFLQAVLEKK